jgi:hypothetical protein
MVLITTNTSMIYSMEMFSVANEYGGRVFAVNIADPTLVNGGFDDILGELMKSTGGMPLRGATPQLTWDNYTNPPEQEPTTNITDTDGDGLYDWMEVGGMKGLDGKIYYSNPNKSDTDEDELTDSQELEIMTFEVKEVEGETITTLNGNSLSVSEESLYAEFISQNEGVSHVFRVHSNPQKKDTDYDGLLDGVAKYVGSKKVAPKDPDPLEANGPIGIWQEQLEMEESGNIPHDLVSYDEIVFEQSGFGKWPSASIGGGAMILHFRYDKIKMALHAQVETWQKKGGYCDLYDDLFYLGTDGNMRKVKFPFSYNGEEYVIWAWRGWYYQLESGAEIGMYTNPHDVKVGDVVLIKNLWDAVDFEIPMTLNLYNVYGNNNVQNVFSWAPTQDQWWITGFNPEFTSPQAAKMAVLGTLDFTGREEMFGKLREAVSTRKDLQDYMIFDEDSHTVWLIWWGE